jgi:hypothetical protein
MRPEGRIFIWATAPIVWVSNAMLASSLFGCVIQFLFSLPSFLNKVRSLIPK